MRNKKNNRLIVLRGPSGSGKTTIAKRLFALTECRTALIQQDYYRFIFKPSDGGSKSNSTVIHEMIEHNCSCALEAGYDVILEGILSVKSYLAILNRIIDQHPGPSHMFYFDMSFEETARRHASRQNASEFTIEDMRQWYAGSHRSYHPLERLIPESCSEERTVETIFREIMID